MAKRKSSGRQGSALLIVLGMFAFMLVSAVSFSIYMRASRAPSSYVRRNASARHLVKAALARAIDEIDTAIGNDPFPGVGYNHDYGSDGLNQGDKLKNDNWHGRVFTPSNEVAYADTVSTLSLEALGYLPPNLINEVRYWSRHTRTAKWHSFNYGLGQYAFTAVNVSDFFDLNQLIDLDGVEKQRLNRSSSEHGRVSPAYLFRNSNNSDMDTGGSMASAFLTAMKDGSAFGVSPSLQDVPFVSMMDFNLALGGNPLGGIASPFMARLNGSSGTFYEKVGEDAVRRQVFMAGGWNGDSNLTYQAYSSAYGGRRVNLKYPEFQPFAGYSWFPKNTTLSHCYNDVSESHPFWQPLNKDFPILSTALLCDYLDYDNVPLSLCIPCAEAVPMICGVELNDDCVKYKVECVQKGGDVYPIDDIYEGSDDVYTMQIEVSGLVPILTTVYPFANGVQGQSPDFKAETFARVFFTAEGGDAWNKGLRTSAGDFSLGDSFDWSVNKEDNIPAYIQIKGGTADIRSDGCRGVGEDAEKSVIQEDISTRSSDSVTKKKELARNKYRRKKATQDEGPGQWEYVETVGGAELVVYDGNWNAVNFAERFKPEATADETKYRPSVAIWARIKSGDKTVDMVPAISAYDNLNGFAENKNINGFSSASGGNAGTPLLRFFAKTDDDASGIRLNPQYFIDNNGASRSAQWHQKAYIANDPRINWAPEQWWATDQTAQPKELWFENVKTFRENNSWCDLDIFMSASDQGYMQSVYEWMLIPQVLRIRKDAEDYDRNNGNMQWGVFEQGSGYDGEVNTAVGDVLHSDVMWRTHRSSAFMKEGVDPDTWEWGLVDRLPFDDSDTGLRVNPYTDSMNVMLGAFANMPRDWWAASTNHLALGKNYMAPGSSLDQNYLFDWSCNYQDVYNMAYYWMGAFKRWDMSNKEERSKLFYMADYWKEVFEDAVYWYDGRIAYSVPVVTSENTTLDSGVLNDSTVEPILKDLTMAERKFLYGYLKGCFANTHQLFLIFVRAESAAGGGGAGSGARAVALVWRDPNAPMRNGQFVKADGGTENPQYGKDNAQSYLNLQNNANEESWRLNARKYPPHKTRILFYHQLD